MKLKFLAPLILFISLAVFLGLGLKLDPRKLPSTMIGKQAPAFELNLLNASGTKVVESGKFKPSDLIGQQWILNIWASWCVACRVEHPLLNELANKTDITLVGLNYKDKTADAEKWLAEHGNPYAYIPKDIEGDTGIEWGVYGVPETYVIDQSGKVIYKNTGPLNSQIINSELLPLFGINQ